MAIISFCCYGHLKLRRICRDRDRAVSERIDYNTIKAVRSADKCFSLPDSHLHHITATSERRFDSISQVRLTTHGEMVMYCSPPETNRCMAEHRPKSQRQDDSSREIAREGQSDLPNDARYLQTATSILVLANQLTLHS